VTVKLVYLARRAATVAREDWPRTWRSHAIFASQFPVLEAKIDWMRYCNRIDGLALPGLSDGHDGVAVAASDSLEGLNGAGFSAGDRALIDADELRVFDRLTPQFTWYCEELPERDGPLGEVCLWSFLKARDGLDRAEFQRLWLARPPETPALATRQACNRPLGERLPQFPYDGIVETWFADEAGMIAAGLPGLPDSCDPAGSTMVATRVCHRWPKG